MIIILMIMMIIIFSFGIFCFHSLFVQLKIVTTSGIHLSSYIPSTEWELIHAQAVIEYNPFDEEGGYSFVQFQLRIQRKSLYYIVNLILPCIMLSLVMLFGQYLPCNSGKSFCVSRTKRLIKNYLK